MKTLKIEEKTYERLLDLKVDLQKSLKRSVTFSETIGIAVMDTQAYRYALKEEDSKDDK